MRGKDRLIILAALAGMALSFAAASWVMGPINQMRSDLQLTANRETLAGMPPRIAFTYAMMGSFRGLMVDVLWGRATKLKEEGKFYEAMQLSSWICDLQPRFAQVWAFHAWNMAYNISVATHTERERWMWVRAGIELLRDRGIPLNPASTQLYRELAWIFLHKVGQFSDDMHYYYKRELAREWHEVLGPPPPGPTQAVLDAFAPIAEAYQVIAASRTGDLGAQLDLFTAEHPEVLPLVADLRRMDWALEVDLLRTMTRLRDRSASLQAGIWPADRAIGDSDREMALARWLREVDRDTPEARDALLAFLTARVLSAHYHMDPSFMYELMRGEWLSLEDNERMRSLGFDDPASPKPLPLDWRHPAAHGLYWSALGVRVAEDARSTELDDTRFQILNTDRNTLHALQALTHNGRITYDPVTGYYTQLPDARFIRGYERAVITAGSRIGGAYLRSAAPDSFKSGHENFLIWATQLAYVYGSMEQARQLYQRLATTYGKFQHDRVERYSQPLDQFMLAHMTENLTSIDDATQFISGQLTQALIEGYANGNPPLARRRFELAQEVHRWYTKKQARETFGATVRHRNALPSLSQMQVDVFQQMLLLPAGGVNPLLKARVWRNAPEALKRRVFDRVRAPLYQQAQQVGLDPRRAFPEPPGMDAYRKANPPAPALLRRPGADDDAPNAIQANPEVR